jgi:hypothetical protein
MTRDKLEKHVISITELYKKIIFCQIFYDLILKSDFERIFNVMQLHWSELKLSDILSENI